MAKIENYGLKVCWKLAWENGWIPSTMGMQGGEWWEGISATGMGDEGVVGGGVGGVVASTAIRAQ